MPDLRKALSHELDQNIEAAEARIRELRREASRRLAMVSADQDQNILTLCGLIFGILALQDDLNRERHRLVVLGQ
jgi:hypothetical protein